MLITARSLFSGLLLSQLSAAFWRMGCDNPLTFERLDPLVSPGGIAGHVHNVAGGSNFGPNANYNSLRESSCTSCPIKEDLSAYWTPQLYYRYQNGSVKSVPNGGTTVYYLQRNTTGDTAIRAFPEGFRMISGNPALRSWSNTREQQAVNFVCLNFQTGSSYGNSLPNTDCPDGLRLQLVFPSCWDGVNLDSANHKSHMGFPSGISTGQCDDPKYPIRLITIFYEVFYDVTDYKDMWYSSQTPFVLANGDPTGYSFHGDFINGWDVPVLQKAIDTCTDLSGSMDVCKAFTVQHPSSSSRQCHKSPSVDEVVMDTVLPELPGCNPIQAGPANAVTPAASSCPSYVVPSLTLNTTGYYGNIVPAGYLSLTGVSTVQSLGAWSYIGCYQDASPRVLPKQYGPDAMTVDICLSTCQANGYTYAGLEWASQCWCGNSLSATQLDYQSCYMPCAGNSSQYCGAGMALTTYKLSQAVAAAAVKAPSTTSKSSTRAGFTSAATTTTSAVTSWSYVGCYTDSWTRTVKNRINAPATVDGCQAACAAAGYTVAAMENWNECYCDNTIQTTGTQAAEADCHLKCSANASQTCGGPWRLSVYRGNTGTSGGVSPQVKVLNAQVSSSSSTVLTKSKSTTVRIITSATGKSSASTKSTSTTSTSLSTSSVLKTSRAPSTTSTSTSTSKFSTSTSTSQKAGPSTKVSTIMSTSALTTTPKLSTSVSSTTSGTSITKTSMSTSISTSSFVITTKISSTSSRSSTFYGNTTTILAS